MLGIAVGWLGWSEEQALHADINLIHLGYDETIKKFITFGELIGLVKKKATGKVITMPKKGLAPTLTPKAFDMIFG